MWIEAPQNIAESVAYEFASTMSSQKAGDRFTYRGNCYKDGRHNTYVTNIELSLAKVHAHVNRKIYERVQKKAEWLQDDGVDPHWVRGWHATTVEYTKAIMKNGFDRGCSKHQAFGEGTYFARDASYSWATNGGYMRLEKDGDEYKGYLILSRIILGNYCRGVSAKRVNEMDGDMNSVVGVSNNNIASYPDNPDIFVLGSGSDLQVYPEFVLEFRSRV